MSSLTLHQQNILLQNRERILQQLLKYPNVLSLGVGLKEINRTWTDTLCYRVYVSEKKTLAELKHHEIIPTSIDGFSLDVIVYGTVEEIKMDNTPYRPLKGGIQIKNDLYVDDSTRGGGTLGCLAFLDDGSNQIVGLTNEHVVAWNSLSNPNPPAANDIGQPWKRICCCCCTKDVVGKVLSSLKTDSVDCASIELHTDIVNDIRNKGTINEIFEIGAIKGTVVAVAGMLVKKRGAGTRLTHGIVKDVAFDHGQILIGPVDPYEKFADFGDSGSIVLNEDNLVVGLLWAAERNRFRIPGEPIIISSNLQTKIQPRIHGVATPIQIVETTLGIRIPVPPPATPVFSVHSNDTKTHAIPSTLPAAQKPKVHFVTAKGDDDIILKVSFAESIDPNRVAWVSDNPLMLVTSPGVGTDKLTAKIKRNVLNGMRSFVGVTVDGYAVGERAAVWIVWSEIKADYRFADYEVSVREVFTTLVHTVAYEYKIQPPEIIPTDINTEDVPDLRGANTASPPNVPDTDTNVMNKGVDLSAGVKSKWDATRKIKCKVINPEHIVLPQSEPFNTSYLNYPSQPDVGNGDTSTLFLFGSPYSGADGGKLKSIISQTVLSHSVPQNIGLYDPTISENDTLEFRIHLEEFARVELGGHWYRISDFDPWRIVIRFRKASEFKDGTDYDNDGDKTGEVWISNVTQVFNTAGGF